MKLADYRRLCQKNENENYLLDQWVFRKISIFFTILFIKTHMKPNQATFLSLLASLGSLVFLTYNSRPMLLAGALFIFVYYLLDHVDGELARYYRQTGGMTPGMDGHYFDVLVHRYSSNLMAFFLGLGIYRAYGCSWAVIFGFIACIGISSFPNVVAAQVLAGKIAGSRQLLDRDTNLQSVLQVLETRQKQIQAVRHGRILQKLQKFVVESLFFPGHILLLIITLIFDAYVPGFLFLNVTFNARMVFLITFTVLYTLKTVLQSILWLKRMSRIA